MLISFDIAGNPKYIDNPFLWIASNFFMISVGVICQTGQPYSMIDLTRLLYILSSFVLEMFTKPFISLIIWIFNQSERRAQLFEQEVSTLPEHRFTPAF